MLAKDKRYPPFFIEIKKTYIVIKIDTLNSEFHIYYVDYGVSCVYIILRILNNVIKPIK